MSNKSRLQINVFLSGKDLEKFYEIKKRLYISSDAELLRICMRHYYDTYPTTELLREIGIDLTKPAKEIRVELDSIKKKLEKFD